MLLLQIWLFLILILSQFPCVTMHMKCPLKAITMLLSIIKFSERENTFIAEKVWIATTLSYLSIRLFSKNIDLQRKHVLFSFLGQTKKRGQYYNFNSYSSSEEEFVKEAFQCSISRSVLSKKVWERCTEKEKGYYHPMMCLQEG
ncbi:hypothetical protein E2320_014580 [Naja naja]|nr:hypothetical protein E2320_014580 [Naja naja]